MKQQQWQELGCPFCGTHPKEVVYDGVSICVKKEHCVGIINPKQCMPNAKEIHNKNMPNSRFIQEYIFRKDMLSYVCTRFGNYKRDRLVECLNDEGMDFCDNEMKKYPRYNTFLKVMDWAETTLRNGNNKLPEGFSYFLFFFCFLFFLYL